MIPTFSSLHGRRSAFTLIELSIVLVVIGLIVGGALVGQDLIAGAKNRSALSQQQAIVTAINTFKLKYNGLPGDIPNASSFWPDCDTPSNNCNGDDDKIVDGLFSPDNERGESWRTWRQLADAGFISGNFTGKTDTSCSSGSYCAIAGTNVPVGVHEGSMWSFFITRSTAGYNGPDRTRNALIYSTPHANGRWYGALLKPLDAFTLDDKIDDGMPYTGRVSGFAGGGYITGCSTPGNSAATDEYDVTDSAKRCLLFFDYD